MDGKSVARGRARFGIEHGIAELLAPRLARAAGVEGLHRMVAVFGAREIVWGNVVLSRSNPGANLWCG